MSAWLIGMGHLSFGCRESVSLHVKHSVAFASTLDFLAHCQACWRIVSEERADVNGWDIGRCTACLSERRYNQRCSPSATVRCASRLRACTPLSAITPQRECNGRMSRVGRKGSDNKYALVHQQSKQAKDRGGEAFVLSHGTEGHALTFNLKKGLFTEGTGRLFPVEGLLTSLNLDVFFCFFGKREKQARPQSTRNSARQERISTCSIERPPPQDKSCDGTESFRTGIGGAVEACE